MIRTGGAGLALLLAVAAGCTRGPSVRPLRIALTESAGDLTFSLEEPVRAVTCIARDYRRAPTDPGAMRVVWSARCTADCLRSVRYGDRALESTTPASRLVPSGEGDCYECELTGDHGRGLVRFRMGARGGFEPCRLQVIGDL